MPNTLGPTPHSQHAVVHPSPDRVAWEDDSTLQLDVRLVDDTEIKEPRLLPGFTSIIVECFATEPMPQDRQFVLTLPTEKYDMERGALVGVARGIQWWDPGMPVRCKIVNRGNKFAKLVRGHPVAHMIAVNTRDTYRFYSLVDSSSSTLDPSALSPEQLRPTKPAVLEHQPHEQVCAEDANCGQLSVKQRAHLDSLLHHFISGGLFPTDPKRVPACVDGELSLPLIDESCTPVAEKQRRFSPQDISMVREEIDKLNDRGIIHPSKSSWAAQVLCVKKKDDTMRLCVDWRRLNYLLVIDSGGLGDMQSMFSNLKGKRYFTQIDLASGFHQLPIAEKDKHKTAFRGADGKLWEFNRAGFGLTVLPAAFTRIVKTALTPPEESVVSWLDDIFITNTIVTKESGSEINRGQFYDYRAPYWRV